MTSSINIIKNSEVMGSSNAGGNGKPTNSGISASR